MTDQMKPYPDYKDSALKWLGKIPSHWTEKRAKYFLREVDERSTTGEEQLMSVSHKTGVTPRKSNVTMFKAESNIGHKICRVDDLAINTLWAWMSALGVSRYTGLVSPAYGVYRQVNSDNFDSEYLDYLLRTPAYATEYRCKSTGITSSRLRLYPIDFLRIPLIQPPREEQEKIVRYLKHQDALIRQFIRNRRRLIEVLTEQKQAIINRAVTRGLDPSVKLKPSGVDWLGDVPEHWEVVKLKQVADIRYGLGQPPREAPDGLPLLRATNVKSGKIVTKNLVYVDPDDVPQTRDAFLRTGEILVVRSGALTADSAIVPDTYEGAVAGYDMVVTATKAHEQFLATVLLSPYMLKDQLYFLRSRAAQPHLNKEELGNSIVVMPPINEQGTIVSAVAKTIGEFDAMFRIIEQEMLNMREYRSQLIADAVTGKFDVQDEELSGIVPGFDIEESLDEDDLTDEPELDEELAHADD